MVTVRVNDGVFADTVLEMDGEDDTLLDEEMDRETVFELDADPLLDVL